MIGTHNKTDLEALRHAQAIDGMLDRALNDNQRLRDEDLRLRQELQSARATSRTRFAFLLICAGLLVLTWGGIACRWMVR